MQQPALQRKLDSRPSKKPEVIDIPDEFIRSIFLSQSVYDSQGKVCPLTGHVRRPFAEALYRTVIKHKPKLVVEIGMAEGISTVVILSALDRVGEGTLISIDPYQSTNWRGIGLETVRRRGLQDRHRVIESFDYLALPQLLADGLRLDFAFIDGWHTFDYTLLDFFYIDKMMNLNGVVGFNDCGYPAVTKVLGYVMTHRAYGEVNVGLGPPSYHHRIRMATKRLSNRTLIDPYAPDRYFQKLKEYEPRWDFFAEF